MNHEISIIEAVDVDSTNPVTLRPLIANLCQATQISRRLANRLGLYEFQSVYVKDMWSGKLMKWELSLSPILIRFNNANNLPSQVSQPLAFSYPIVPTTSRDLFWEMIIGQDVFSQWQQLISDFGGSRPTPGPSYVDGANYMSHNISFAAIQEIPIIEDEIIELQCSNPVSVKRLAWNRSSKILYLQFIGNVTPQGYLDGYIVQYDISSIHQQVEGLLINQGISSIDEIISLLQTANVEYTNIDEFPIDTVLVGFDCSTIKIGIEGETRDIL